MGQPKSRENIEVLGPVHSAQDGSDRFSTHLRPHGHNKGGDDNTSIHNIINHHMCTLNKEDRQTIESIESS